MTGEIKTGKAMTGKAWSSALSSWLIVAHARPPEVGSILRRPSLCWLPLVCSRRFRGCAWNGGKPSALPSMAAV